MSTNTETWGNIELPGLSDEKLFKINWHRHGRVIEAFKNKPPEFFIERGKKITEGKLNNPHPTKGKKLPKEWTDAMSKSLKGHKKSDTSKMNKTKKKPLMSEAGPFASVQDAQNHFGYKWEGNVRNKINKGHPGWYWITVEEYIMLTGKDI
jgi:hypothetical protein